ncbi:MAG: class I SAM-dependent methyltransferase [Methylobacter sp.]
MNDITHDISNYSNRPIEERAHWYTPAAQAYDKARPHYPAELISHVAHLTQLESHSKILEVGCGPGTATTAFAEFGCSIVCVELNPGFCELARRNCKQFQNVVIKQSSFEEWPIEASAFDIVVSASAFHWIQPQVGYPKVAETLRDDGYFVLLWNKEPQPTSDVCQLFEEIYSQHDLPSLGRFETEAAREQMLKELAQPAIDSGVFKEVSSKQVKMEGKYTAEDYLLLLSSFAPYLNLEESRRNSLFAKLRRKINDDLMGLIDLSYISAANIFQKIAA